MYGSQGNIMHLQNLLTTYPHICLPHIFHGQGQCPGKSSHSSDNWPDGVNHVLENLVTLLICWNSCLIADNIWTTHQSCSGVSRTSEVGGGYLMSMRLRGRVKSPTRKRRTGFRDGLVEVSWQGQVSLRWMDLVTQIIRTTKTAGYHEGDWIKTYVLRVVKSCGRSLKRCLPTPPENHSLHLILIPPDYSILMMVLFIVKTMMLTMMVTLSGSPPKSAMWSWIHSSANNFKLALDFCPIHWKTFVCPPDLIKQASIARDLVIREAHEAKWANPADVMPMVIVLIIGRGQWSMVNGQCLKVNGQWSMVNGQW